MVAPPPRIDGFDISDPALVPSLLKAAGDNKVERCLDTKGLQLGALKSGIEISGNALLGVEGAALTFFANGANSTAMLKSGDKVVKLASQQKPDLSREDRPSYLIDLPDGTDLQVVELGPDLLTVDRYGANHDSVYGASFVPDEATGDYVCSRLASAPIAASTLF